jgi:hypothetical protein
MKLLENLGYVGVVSEERGEMSVNKRDRNVLAKESNGAVIKQAWKVG